MKRLLILAMFLSGCSMIGPGERGVRVSFGSAGNEVLSSGYYIWIPFITRVDAVDIQIQKNDVESTGATKDMQDVHAEVAVNWSVDPANVVKTYKEIGDERVVWHRIVIPAVNEVMKASTAKRTAEEVLTKRMDMKKDIDTGLKERLAQYGIAIHDVSIVNLKFSEGFTQAIEHKQIAEQQAQQASYVAAKAIQDAKAEVERAKGQATAQQLIRSSITPEILQQKAIEKWDGKFPQVMGSGALPFLNIKMKGE